MIYDFAQNKQKLQRILDKMPNASEEAIKAEYIKNAGLLNKEETTDTPKVDISVVSSSNGGESKVKRAVKAVKRAVSKK